MPDIWKQQSLTSGDLELIILPGIGGRLWDIIFQGRSLLFQNGDLEGYVPDLEDIQGFPTRSPQFGFPLWGGEKTWIAPDTNWQNGAPFAALDSGPYAVVGSSPVHMTLQSTICPQSGLQIERQIRLTNIAGWTIQTTVTNHGPCEQDVGIWSVMMIKHKARIGVPGSDLRANPVFGEPASFVSFLNEGLICDCDKPGEFKIGMDNPSGRTFMRVGTGTKPIWMRCETGWPVKGDEFAHSYPLEVFNSGDYPYCEAEWHAPLKTLPHGAATEFCQHFTLWADLPESELIETDLELLQCMC